MHKVYGGINPGNPDKHFNNNDHREYTKEETLTTTDNDEKRQTNEQNRKSFYTENWTRYMCE